MHVSEKSMIAEKHQLELLRIQLDARQQTMQFIGQEIHDSVTQKLTLASIYSQQLETEHDDPSARVKFSGISNIINDSLSELKDLSRNLTDTKLQNASFIDLIGYEAAQINATGICRISIDCDKDVIFSTMQKSSLIRVVQEFIQNSIKHAACNVITIKLSRKPEFTELKLDDNGKGFNVNDIKRDGIGLGNMKRRVQFLGGVFQLNSTPGEGTSAIIQIPV